MPFILRYRMLVGASSRESLTAAEAVSDYRELQQAGAGLITIHDHTGRVFTLDELISASAAPAKLTKSRPDV